MDPYADLKTPPTTAATVSDVPGGVGAEESTVVGMVMQQPVADMGARTPEEEIRKMKVMVALDESDGSFYALRWTLDHLFRGRTLEENDRLGRVTVVHVQQPFQQYVFPAGPGGSVRPCSHLRCTYTYAAFYASSAVVESVKKAQEENATFILSRALQMCREKLVKAESLIMNGDPKDMLCQATEQMHMDLLVVGSRGLGMIKRAFLGSVSDYCAHHAKCPILIVKPPKEVTNK
ncbi:universal stress protein A-like protein isoform X1 [Punica granatum]|uniref:Universal stress protein A-like protein isoform X1 n=1 Tax=Punica granatum TaxID=22663 RepID=A0A6P8CCX1_PUNGR|nr:universal stress protein A-like protein isoform X1 [Punica granatum]